MRCVTDCNNCVINSFSSVNKLSPFVTALFLKQRRFVLEYNCKLKSTKEVSTVKKRNSRRIMMETIAAFVTVVVVMATVIGAAFIIKSWDKVMPAPFEAEQELLTEDATDREPLAQPEALPLSFSEKEDAQGTDQDFSEKEANNEETNTDNETDKPQTAYNEETAQLIVAIATEQLGTPFKSGGDSPDEGFDSTGFTYYCANEAGVEFPRSIKDQLNSGDWVGINELKAGDIVYFSAEVGGNATFCGVYVGGGLIIYSPVPDDFVKTANITTNYWTTHFVTGLRLTSQTNE